MIYCVKCYSGGFCTNSNRIYYLGSFKTRYDLWRVLFSIGLEFFESYLVYIRVIYYLIIKYVCYNARMYVK